MGKIILFYITLLILIFAYTLNAPYLDFDLWARLIAGMGVIEGVHFFTQYLLSNTPVNTWYDN